MLQDLRYAFRQLVKSPGFTAVAVLTLALGIGANTAIFSLLDQILLRPLPVKNPGELVALSHNGPYIGMNTGSGVFSHPMFRDLEKENDVLSGLVANFGTPVNLSHAGSTERAQVQLVSGNYFEVLGVGPALGRLFGRADDVTPGGHPLAVLSHDFWRRRFAGDASILGQTIQINGHPFTVIGVAAVGFRGVEFGQPCDVLVPLMMKAQVTPTWDDLNRRRALWLRLTGRLKPGVEIARAQTALTTLFQRTLGEEVKELSYLSADERQRFVSHPLTLAAATAGHPATTADSRAPLIMVMSLAGAVLLIACANVANLLVARAAARQKEIAVRLALGAGRWRIARQTLLESLLLALLGGAAGIVLAFWLTDALGAILPGEQTVHWFSPELDARVLLFALAASLLTSVLFGFAPALLRSRTSLAQTINNQSAAVVGGRGLRRFFHVLAAGQLALALVLLIVCALFAGSLYQLSRTDPGFPIQRLVAFSVDASTCGYQDAETSALYQRLQERLAALPGVASASISRYGLLRNSSWGNTVRFEGTDADTTPRSDFTAPGLFATLGIPVILGREFTARDVRGAQPVAIINEVVAKKYFPGQNPLGRHVFVGRDPGFDIVGVVKTVHTDNLREPLREFVYRPLLTTQNLGAVTFYLRTATPPATLAGLIRATVKELEPNLAVYRLTTAEDDVTNLLVGQRLMAQLTTAFGLLATVLAAIGLYGVLSYTVTRRTREIGIRMALGAGAAKVTRLVLRDVAVLTAIGAAIALPAAYGLCRLMQAVLFGISGSEPVLFATATVLLALVALAAGFLPARRAAKVDPNEALRSE